MSASLEPICEPDSDGGQVVHMKEDVVTIKEEGLTRWIFRKVVEYMISGGRPPFTPSSKVAAILLHFLKFFLLVPLKDTDDFVPTFKCCQPRGSYLLPKINNALTYRISVVPKNSNSIPIQPKNSNAAGLGYWLPEMCCSDFQLNFGCDPSFRAFLRSVIDMTAFRDWSEQEVDAKAREIVKTTFSGALSNYHDYILACLHFETAPSMENGIVIERLKARLDLSDRAAQMRQFVVSNFFPNQDVAYIDIHPEEETFVMRNAKGSDHRTLFFRKNLQTHLRVRRFTDDFNTIDYGMYYAFTIMELPYGYSIEEQ